MFVATLEAVKFDGDVFGSRDIPVTFAPNCFNHNVNQSSMTCNYNILIFKYIVEHIFFYIINNINFIN